MIKIKLKYFLNSYNSLQGLLALPLPSKVHYDLAKILKKLKDEAEIYEETRRKKMKDLGTEEHTKDDIQYHFTPENRKMLDEELKSVVDLEIEINSNTVPFNALNFKDNEENQQKFVNLGNYLADLTWLITD